MITLLLFTRYKRMRDRNRTWREARTAGDAVSWASPQLRFWSFRLLLWTLMAAIHVMRLHG